MIFCQRCFTVSSQSEHVRADIEVTCDLLEIRHSICWGGIVGNLENNEDEEKSGTCCTDNHDQVQKKTTLPTLAKKQNQE